MRLADFIVGHGHALGEMSITDLSSAAQVSPMTVTRFAKLLGFDGFPQLRIAFARESGRGVEAGWMDDIGRDVRADDNPQRVLDVVTAVQSHSLRRASEVVDTEAASRVADLIVVAKQILIYGEWSDSLAAIELHMRLFWIGWPALLDSGVQAATVQGSLMEPGDIAIMIVHSGDDPAARQILRRAASVGAHTVLVTETANTPLGREPEIKLQTRSTTSDAVSPLFGTRPGQLLVMGYLWLLAAQRMPETAAEATAFIGKR